MAITNTRTPFLKSINPVNKEEEKQKFLFDELYNPQFVYASTISKDKFEENTHASNEHEEIALTLVNKMVKAFGSDTVFFQETQTDAVNRETVEKEIKEYVKPYPFAKDVVIRFSPHFIARTSATGYTINVREPIEYKRESFVGMLHHEIGTHLLRRINDEQQPWRKNRTLYALHDHIETEEGLATIHSHMFLPNTILWLQALYYLTAYWAQSMSFAELNAKLKQYIDEPEKRWNMCLRVKRGIQDTSAPGTFAKDQSYFSGAIKVLTWMSKNNYDISPLYYGKIDIEDIEMVKTLNPNYIPMLPTFYTESPKKYAEMIKKLMKENAL